MSMLPVPFFEIPPATIGADKVRSNGPTKFPRSTLKLIGEEPLIEPPEEVIETGEVELLETVMVVSPKTAFPETPLSPVPSAKVAPLLMTSVFT